jgi:quinol monooxygenase YgiN
MDRRLFITSSVAAASLGLAGRAAGSWSEDGMYGLIGKIEAVEGGRDELVAILVEGVAGMQGCLSYVVARDPNDANGIWVTEVWDSEESHRASLGLPSVQAAISKGRPLIAGFAQQTVTDPVGGHGLVEA